MRHLCKLAMVLAMLLFSVGINAQVRGNIGLGYGLNKASPGSYKMGDGYLLQGTIPITDKFALVTAIGIEQAKADVSALLDRNDVSYVDDLKFVYWAIWAKYHIYKGLFVRLGPHYYVTGADGGSLFYSNVRGSGAIGYDLDLDDHSTFEFSAGNMFVKLYSGYVSSTSVMNIKVAYVFNFRARE